MKLDLYMGAEKDQKMADKYKKMGPKFVKIMLCCWIKAFKVRNVKVFNNMYSSDPEIAQLVGFLMKELFDNRFMLEAERFDGLSKKRAKIYRIDEDTKLLVLWQDMMRQFLEQNPKFNTAVEGRKKFNADLSVFSIPRNIDSFREDILKARLKRKEKALEEDRFNQDKRAAYLEACRLMEGFIRYKALVADKVITPILSK